MTKERRNELVVENMPLVYYLLRNYRNWHNYEDLVQQGVIGMIMAFDRQQDDEHINMNYVCKYIKGYVQKYIRYVDVPVKPYRDMTYEYYSIDADITDDEGAFSNLYADKKDYIDELITVCAYENMINQLSEKIRRPLMYMLEGYGIGDAAKMAGISHQRVDQIRKQCDRRFVTV